MPLVYTMLAFHIEIGVCVRVDVRDRGADGEINEPNVAGNWELKHAAARRREKARGRGRGSRRVVG